MKTIVENYNHILIEEVENLISPLIGFERILLYNTQEKYTVVQYKNGNYNLVDHKGITMFEKDSSSLRYLKDDVNCFLIDNDVTESNWYLFENTAEFMQFITEACINDSDYKEIQDILGD